MSELNASSFIQNIVRFGLVAEPQARQVWEDLDKTTDLGRLIRAFEKQSLLTPWQTSKMLKNDEDGYFLGGYRILYKIASGSFGRVFRAEDPQSGRVVAIKVLRRRWSEDQQRIDLFMREGKMGLTLQHPNIVEVLTVNQDAVTGQFYIVMEFVEGGNLKEILAIREKLGVEDALRLTEELTQGLTFAHAHGINHRDIKLTNVLISSSGTAKLVDFGLAQILDDAGKKDEFVERTVDYAGLEKLTGVPRGDIRSDIYFLGTVVYHMLTGRSPIYWSRDRHARMNPHRFKDVAPIDREELDAPPSVFQLVANMMTLKVNERFQTPKQLLEAIQQARRDVARQTNGESAADTGPQSVFLVESDQRLQEVLRDKLKEKGYRVFLAMDPFRALDRFRQRPYDGLIVDAGTTGEEGMLVFERIINDADRQGIVCAGILILSEEQAEWEDRLRARKRVKVMVRPVTTKQLHRTLQELLRGK